MTAVKLAITSDLHLPITPAERISAVAREMAAFAPDAAVVAGDLGESLGDLGQCLKLVKEQLPCPIWVLPGEHDFWARPPYDSGRLWKDLIPQAVAAAGCHWLEGTAFVVRDTAVAGTIAWYDYSSADPRLKESALAFAQQKYRFNADALRIDWEWSDPEFARQVSAPLLSVLDNLEADATVRRIVVVTHMPLVEDQLIRPPDHPEQVFATAYQGNLTLGRQVLTRRKVSHIISGHVHTGRTSQVARADAPVVDVRIVPSDYEHPGWVSLTFEVDGGR
jgi:3',5'-cyclic AMP phosphodiesterase CpdA